MKTHYFTLLAVAIIFLSSCFNTPSGKTIETISQEEIIEVMRADTSFIAYQDSLAVIQLGAGAKCLDPVKHLFTKDNRFFLYCSDWGGVVELPDGWIPEDDFHQAIVSFHGTVVYSPDSLAMFSLYAGLNTGEPLNEQIEWCKEGLSEDNFGILSEDIYIVLMAGTEAPCYEVTARNGEGLNLYRKGILRDNRGVEMVLSLQYYDGYSGDVQELLKYLETFPFGPDGQLPVGAAL